MRVLCINAGPLEEHGNADLHLLQEGVVYHVISVNEEGNYNIGIRPKFCIDHNVECFWGSDRFLECSDIADDINIKGRVDGKDKGPSTEGD